MPTYTYRCSECEQSFDAIHSIKISCNECSLCGSTRVTKAIVPFAAKTDTSMEAQQRHFDEQGKKDLARFQRDDKFAANIIGADDPNSLKRKAEAMKKQQEYAKQKQEAIAKSGNPFRRVENGKA